MGQNGVKTHVNAYHHLYNEDRVFCGVWAGAEEIVDDLKITEADCSLWGIREEVVGDLNIMDRHDSPQICW